MNPTGDVNLKTITQSRTKHRVQSIQTPSLFSDFGML